MTVVDLKSGAREPWHGDQLAAYVLCEPDPRITFVEEGHRYFAEGNELVSVTKLVNPNKNPFYRPGSANRGKSIHIMCALDAQGILDESTVAEEWKGYLEAFRGFVQEMRPTFIAYEQIVGHVGLGIAGRRDLLIQLPGDPDTLTDGMVLYLKKTGKYATTQLNGLELARRVSEVKKLAIAYHEKGELEVW
jgi:hypothetical protein